MTTLLELKAHRLDNIDLDFLKLQIITSKNWFLKLLLKIYFPPIISTELYIHAHNNQ